VLTDWWTTYSTNPPPHWSELKNPEKHQVLEALLCEQHHVCVYCGKRITIEYHRSHIEHFWPQSKFHNRRFEWNNLFASCGPTGHTNTPQTCGDHKGGWTPTNHIDPADPHCEQRFSYDGNGTISPSPIGGAQAAKMIEKLNLDDDSLDYDRFSIVAELEEWIQGGEIDALNVAQEIALWRDIDQDGKLKSYGHVAARYLEDEPL